MASTVIPTFRYADAPRMIDWLCVAIGFERHFVVEDEDGGVAHAQLRFGPGMIMLGSARDDAFGALQRPPSAGAALTSSAYLVTDDIDAVAERLRRAGAEIVTALHDTDYGSREISARDPEGQLWTIGDYDPWRVVPS